MKMNFAKKLNLMWGRYTFRFFFSIVLMHSYTSTTANIGHIRACFINPASLFLNSNSVFSLPPHSPAISRNLRAILTTSTSTSTSSKCNPYSSSIYQPRTPSYLHTSSSSSTTPTSYTKKQLSKVRHDSPIVPPLTTTPPLKIALLVEPTPFTHVSGYSNRYNAMLTYLSKAGDNVEIVTTDDKPKDELPTESCGFNISHTLGFRFPLYNHICLTFDLPDLKGLRVLERQKPDIIHVTSPGFFLFAGIMYSRLLKIPLVFAYHTHLPVYGKNYLPWVPGIEEFSWKLIRWAHKRADLTLVTSSQMRKVRSAASEASRAVSEASRAVSEASRAVSEASRAVSQASCAVSQASRAVSEASRAVSEASRAVSETNQQGRGNLRTPHALGEWRGQGRGQERVQGRGGEGRGEYSLANY